MNAKAKTTGSVTKNTESTASQNSGSKKNSNKLIKDKPFAVLSAGGKQFLVQEGSKFRMSRIDGESGASVTMSDVLLVGSEGNNLKVGTPSVEGASVKLKILRQAKSKKVLIFKKKRRKGYTKKQGHRQDFTEVQVESISF